MKTFRILAAMAIAALIVASCSSAQVQQTQTKIDGTIAAAQPTLAMACWGVQAADAVFKATYVGGKSADPAVVGDEAKAVTAAGAICAHPPANLAQAVADVMMAYKAVQKATPAQVAPGT